MREFTWNQCHQHALQLGRAYEKLQAQDTEVLIIGGGEVKDAERVARMFELPFPILADPDRKIYDFYGLEKVLWMVQRSATVLVNKERIVQYIHRSIKPHDSLNIAELMEQVAVNSWSKVG